MAFTKFKPSWQQTMFRIKDPSVSLPFYKNKFHFDHIDTYDFPQWKFSVYFLAHLPEGMKPSGPPGSDAAHDFLWNYPGATLELTHNHGTESDPSFKGYDSGNNEPKRGFGHIAVFCEDVYKSFELLEKDGVLFKKKPDEGRMKGLAFAYDPDGYWIEIIKRSENFTNKNREYTYSQTMLRVKDPKKSVEFYKDLGMTLVCERHLDDFSLYFMATLQEDELPPNLIEIDECREWMKKRFQPVLELTHNHGTENQEGPVYHHGNTDPVGFGHIGFLVDDLEKCCEDMERSNILFKKRPQDGNMRGLAFIYDPDGYYVEIVQRGLKMKL